MIMIMIERQSAEGSGFSATEGGETQAMSDKGDYVKAAIEYGKEQGLYFAAHPSLANEDVK